MPPAEAKAFFEKYQRMEAFLNGFIKKTPAFIVKYAAIAPNYDRFAHELYRWLGTEPVKAKPAITKQISRPAREVLGNWTELRDHARGTEYEKYFQGR